MSTEVNNSINVSVDGTEITSQEDIKVTALSSTQEVDNKESVSLVEGYKKEYSIVGDGLYASINTDEAPEWLTAIVDSVVSGAVATGFVDYDNLVQDVRNAIDSIDVAKNTFVEQINFEADVNGIIGSRLETLNATLGNTYATITDLNVVNAGIDGVVTSKISDLNGRFEDIDGRITSNKNLIIEKEGALASDIDALSLSLDNEKLNVAANAEAVSGLQTYVGLTGEGDPNGTGILGSISLLQKQNDGQVEIFTGTHHVAAHDPDPNDNLDENELLTDQWPYALWTPMEGAGNPVATTRVAYKDTVAGSYPIPEHTVYKNTTANTYWEYHPVTEGGWVEITEAEYNLTKEVVRSSHVGDTYINYHVVNGANEYSHSLKFIKTAEDTTSPYSTDAEGYGWALITDSDAEAAYLKALNAYDLADNKRRVFVQEPSGPYDAGDLWVDSSVNPQIVKVATANRALGYLAQEWVQADQQAQDFITNTYTPDSEQIHRQLDGKIEYSFYESCTDIPDSNDPEGVSATESRALELIKAAWTTTELKDAAHGNVVYFKDTRNAYWYTASTNSWQTITDTSIYEALQNAATAQGAADGKVSQFYAWGGENAPADYEFIIVPEVLDSEETVVQAEVKETIPGSNFKYWYKTDGKLYYKPGTTWELVPTSSGGNVYVAAGDIVTVFDPATNDTTVFSYNGSSWQQTGPTGVVSKSKFFVDLENEVLGANGHVATAISSLDVSSKAYADDVSSGVENKFAYNSAIKLGDGKYYSSGFGLNSTGVTQPSGANGTEESAFDSEFWVNAKRFVLTNPDNPGTRAVFTVNGGSIYLSTEYTEATRNVPQGNYSSTTTYQQGDIVSYNNSSYTALKEVTNVTPTNDNINWQLLAAKGETPLVFEWTGSTNWPTSTTEASAISYTFESKYSGNVVIRVLAHDAEGGVRLKFNNASEIPFTRTGADNTQEWYEFTFDNLTAGTNVIKFWSTTGDGGSIKAVEVAFVGARGLDGAFTDFLFTRKATEPNNPGGTDTWYTSVISVPPGSGDLWSIKKNVSAGGATVTYTDKRVIEAPIVRELVIYSKASTSTVTKPSGSTYDFTSDSLAINDTNWSKSIPTVANGQKVYVTTALVSGNSTENSVSVSWGAPSVYTYRQDGISPTVTDNGNNTYTITDASNNSITISDGYSDIPTITNNNDGTFTITNANGDTANITAGRQISVQGTHLNNNLEEYIKITGQNDIVVTGRGHRLVIFDPKSQTVEFNNTYDTYGSAAEADSLAAKINGTVNGKIIILSTYDATRCNQALRDAITACGGTSTETWGAQRVAHAFIGTKGANPQSGYEVVTSATDEVAFVTATFTELGVLPKGYTPVKGVDYFDGANGSFVSFVYKTGASVTGPTGGSFDGTAEVMPVDDNNNSWTDTPTASSTDTEWVSTTRYTATRAADGTVTWTNNGWSTPSKFYQKGEKADALTVSSSYNATTKATTLTFSDGTTATINDGANATSYGVKPIYASNATGANASFTQGTLEYVNYYEWSGSPPTEVPSGLTYVKYKGEDGDKQGVIPIYADDASGTNATFTFNSQKYVNFYEWTTTAPTEVPLGLSYVKFVGADGVSYTGTTEYYRLTNTTTPPDRYSSGTTVATEWETTPQTPTSSNKYLWNFNRTSASDNTFTDSDVFLLTQYVKDGNPGRSISSITEKYQIGSSATTAPTGTWSTSIPSITADNPYLWNQTTIAYSDNSNSTVLTTLIAAKGDDGKDALPNYAVNDLLHGYKPFPVGTGGAGGFWGGPNDGLDIREYDTDAFGGQSVIWKAINNGYDNDADGGFDSQYVSIDPNKRYRFSVFIKQFSNNGSKYFGTHGRPNNLRSMSGSLNSNPYFWNGDLPSSNEWYLVVGYVHASGTGTTSPVDGGVYRVSDGVKVSNTTSYKWDSTNNLTHIRMYQYYNTAVSNDEVWFWYPRIDLVEEGSTISIEELLRKGPKGDKGDTPVKGVDYDDGKAGAGFYGATYDSISTSSTTITNLFYALVGRYPVLGDVFTQTAIVNNEEVSLTKRYDGSLNWVAPDVIVNGDMIVKGGITADNLAANKLSGLFVDAGEITAGVLKSDDTASPKFKIDLNNEKLEIRDANNTVRVLLGKLI